MTNLPLQRFFWALALIGFSTFSLAAQHNPSAVVQQTSEQVQTLLMAEDGNNTDSIREKVDSVLMPRFDFERMTALAVGKNWRKASTDQKQELTSAFKSLLTHTYFSTMLRYRDVKIQVSPDAIFSHKGKRATVKTNVYIDGSETGGQSVSIDYSVYQTSAGWQVYNVSVEGASLVTVYRNQFNEQVSRNGIDGLIDVLKSKNHSNHEKQDQASTDSEDDNSEPNS